MHVIDPDLPMEMRAGYASRTSNETDHIPRLNLVADFNIALRLMPISAKHPPAMIDDCRIAAYDRFTGKDDYAICCRINLKPGAAAKIQPAMEAKIR